jgi:hypothetical protein
MGALFLAILAPGIVAFGCWRIVVGAIAARPISDRLRIAAGMGVAPTTPVLSGADFAVLERLFAAAGALKGPTGGAILIRAYYSVARAIRGIVPALAPWSEHEMAVCSRYLAARVDRFLASNAAYSRRVRSL